MLNLFISVIPSGYNYIAGYLFRNNPVALDLSICIPCGVSPDLTVSCSALRSLHNKVRISLQVLLRSSIYQKWQYIDRKKYWATEKALSKSTFIIFYLKTNNFFT